MTTVLYKDILDIIYDYKEDLEITEQVRKKYKLVLMDLFYKHFYYVSNCGYSYSCFSYNKYHTKVKISYIHNDKLIIDTKNTYDYYLPLHNIYSCHNLD
jgi:hypothetical protein